MNETIIISGCKQKERKAQRMLFEHFAPYVFTICRRYSNADEDARELMQDCFLRVFKKIELFDEQKGSLKNWIAKLTVNEALNKLKKKRKSVEVTNQDISTFQIADASENTQIMDSKRHAMIRGIQQLPEGYRNVLNLFVFERKSHQEIAALLNISAATSRSQLTRAKVQLKNLIHHQETQSYGT